MPEVLALIRLLLLTAACTALMAAFQPRIHMQLNRIQQPDPPPGQTSWMISGYDLSQNQELAQIEHHLEVTDAAVIETNKNLVLLEREISDMQGANRVWFWLLGGLITAIGIAFWKSIDLKKIGPK